MKDELYTLLGVSRDATEEEIKKAYRKAARTNHPDLNPGDSAAEDRFKRIAAAYEVLGNAEKRAIYDEFGPEAEAIGYDSERAEEYRQWKRRAEAAARAGGAFGRPGGGHTTQDMEDLLSELFRRQGRRAAQPRGGGDIEAVLRVPFRDAVLGTKARVSVPRPDGSMADLSLTVPAGVEDGQRLRLGGQGQPGFGEGAPAGDLYVRLEVESHPAFERRGDDLHLTLPVTVPEALVGAKVEVPLLVGSVSVKVPAGSKSGGKLRLRGKGVQSKKRGAGDLILTLEIVMPDAGDDAERARLAEELRQLYREDPRAALRQEVKR